jgi:xanthine/CO dehydrogenase XdhC/CoxF family maturation factor
MLGAPGFDATRLGAAAAELGDRVALLSTGNLPAALSALLRLTGVDVPLTDPRRVEAVQRVSSARALLAFAVSDAYFEARYRSGADRR